jgi:CHAT domain-containing protein
LTAGAGIAALWLGAGSAWAQAEPVAESPEQVRARVQAVCAPYEAGVPAQLDLEAAEAEAVLRQAKAEPGHLELACHAWYVALRELGPSHPTTLRSPGTIAGSLLWLRRPGEAEPIFAGVRAALLATPGARLIDIAKTAGALGYIVQQRGDTAQSAVWFERAYDEMRRGKEVGQEDGQWRIAINLGALLSLNRRFDRAHEVLTETLSEVDSASPQPDPELKGALLGSLASLERRRERLPQAIAYTQQEIAWREAHTGTLRNELVRARHNLAVLWIAMARFEEAEPLLRSALATFDTGEPDLGNHASNLRNTWSRLLLQRGRTGEALQAATEAVRRIEISPEAGSARELRPRRYLAEVLAATGDLAGSVAQYRRMKTWLDDGKGEPFDRIAAFTSFGRVLVELGDHDEAAAQLAAAARELERRPAMLAERAEQRRLSAQLREAHGDTAGALAELRAADEALAGLQGPAHPQRIDLRLRACPADPAACANTRRALDEAGRDAEHPALFPDLEARGWLALGRQARSAGDASAAELAARQALNAAVRAATPALLGLAYGLQADVRADAGRLDEAIFFGKLALAEVQRQRARVVALGAAAEAHFLERRSEVYRSLADRLAGQGRIAEALAVLRLAKRAEQADWGQRGAGALDDEQVAELLPWSPAERRLQQQLAQTLASHQALADEYARLRRLDAARAITADEQARLATLAQQGRQERERLQAQLDALLQTVAAATAPAPGARQGAAPAAVSDAAERAALARVRPREAGVVHAWLMLSPQGLRSVVVGRERSWVRARRVAPQEVSRDIARWLEVLRRQGAGANGRDELGARLYEHIGRLIDEPARQARASRVVLWLDGPLRHLPLAALHDGRQYLAQKYTLLHAAPVLDGAVQGPTARRSAGRGATVPSLLQAFGMTEAAAGLPALPGVARELCGIVRGPVQGLSTDAAATAVSGCADGGTRGQGPVAGEAVANAQFTAARLHQALAAPAAAPSRLLHIGTHFVLRPGHVERSWLLLGDGQRLGLAEVARLDLRGQQLVTLSACETGAPAGDATDGRQIDGLAAAVLGAGARQVLASLWRVDDQATARFMQVFYEESRRAGSPAQGTDWAAALQRTQQRLLAGGGSAARPHDWAAFVLMDARP